MISYENKNLVRSPRLECDFQQIFYEKEWILSLSRQGGSNFTLIKAEEFQFEHELLPQESYSLSGSPGTFLKCLRCQRLFSQKTPRRRPRISQRPFPGEDFREFVSAVFSTLKSYGYYVP